jgi:hypothetical protein
LLFFGIGKLRFSSIGPNTDQTGTKALLQHKKKPLFAQKLSFIGLRLLGPLGACEPAPVEKTASQLPPADSGCGKNGKLQTSLFGSLETTISWSGSDLICQSMRRSNGAAAVSIPELTFSTIVRWDQS